MVAPGRVLLVATRNPGKLAELRSLAAQLGLAAVDLDGAGVIHSPEEEQLEVHATFEDNALAKARYYHRASGGLTTLADDSGLEVDALGGAPGVRSRRWAGAAGDEGSVAAANNAALLDRLASAVDRTARFTCVVAYVDEARTFTCRGAVTGRITHAARGDHGFGYDPLFAADELGGRTFGEASSAEKQRVSHRARAFHQAFARLTGAR